ncbi:MAG: hypothetical protein ABIH77_02010 [Pseudomonadota bacterium]
MHLWYGDDSVNEGLLAYIIVGLKEQNLSSFVTDFQKLKTNYELQNNAILHCRKLFNGSQREKSPEFKHLDLEAVKKLSAEIVNLCVDYKMPRPIFSCAERRYFPNKLLKKQRTIKDKNFQQDEKQGLHLLKNYCLLSLYDSLNKDETKFQFHADKLSEKDKCCKNALPVGGTRKRADMPNFILPTTISGKDEDGGIFRISQINYEDAPFKEMYEIADLFVYTVTKAICTQQYNGKDFFLSLYVHINPIRVLTDFDKRQ